MVGKEEVKAAIGDAGVCTLNALLPAQHTGSGGNSYGRPGRIAGSVNVPAAHLLDPTTNMFLPADELRRADGGCRERWIALSSLIAAVVSPPAPMP